MASYKRTKLNNRAITDQKEEADEDRISSLPDSLLIHILSFLEDTKETVKTCVLSKRWEFVWTNLLEVELVGSYKTEDDEKLGRFVDYVGWILAKCSNLKRFAVYLQYNKSLASNVDHWVYTAIENKITDITLALHITNINDPFYELPQMLYSYSSLSNLGLSFCVMAPLGIISWGSLKSLTLLAVELFDSVMENILSNCPVLETLSLQGCLGLNNLNIKSPNLTRLTIHHLYGDDIFDISAPYLLFLTIIFKHSNRQLRLTNVSSVASATIDFDGLSASNISTVNHMKQFLESIKSVKVLELEHQCVEIISLLEVKSWKLPSYGKLIFLKLKVFNHEISIPGILAILRSSPNLNALIIEVSQPTDEKKKDLDQYEISIEDCDLDLVASRLMLVVIKNFTNAEHLLTLVEILLQSTKALQKMVINLDASSSTTSTDSMEIAKRLLTFHRASRECAVELN